MMLDGFHILTLTHRDAPLSTLAHAMLPAEMAAERLAALKTAFGWEELLYLTTCNRVTFLFYSQDVENEGLASAVLQLTRPDLSPEIIASTAACARLLHGTEAVSHVLEVSASMDSLVVGEREILRQWREAYDRSRALGLTGDHLRLLIRFAIETAKDIYTHTAIGEGAISVVALAFTSMLQKGVRPDDRIVLVGAGQTNTLFGKFLARNGYHRVTVFNRSSPRAEILAQLGQWNALSLNELPFFTEGFDVLIVCTGSAEPVITPAIYRALLAGERTEKVIVDLALPNNVAREVVEANSSQYIALESLKEMAGENLIAREQARDEARAIINKRLPAFQDRWHERQVERLFAHIPEEMRAAKERATKLVFAERIGQLDAPAQALLQEILDYMEKKCVAIPMKTAKTIALGANKSGRKNELEAPV